MMKSTRAQQWRWLILAAATLETFLFGGLVFGWGSLVFVLKQEGVFSHLCPQSQLTNITTNTTTLKLLYNVTGRKIDHGHSDDVMMTASEVDDVNNLTTSVSASVLGDVNNVTSSWSVVTCAEQDDMLSLCFSISSAVLYTGTSIAGAIAYNFGTRVCRLVGWASFTVGSLLVAFTSPECPWLLFGGLAPLGFGGVTLLISNLQIGTLFNKGSATVIACLCGLFDSSSVMSLVIKSAHENGLSRRDSFLLLSGLHVLTLLSTVLLMPRGHFSWTPQQQQHCDHTDIAVPSTEEGGIIGTTCAGHDHESLENGNKDNMDTQHIKAATSTSITANTTTASSPPPPEGKEATEPLVPEGKDATMPLVLEGKEATESLVPEGKEATGPLVPEGKEATEPLVSEGKDATMPLVPEGKETTESLVLEGKEATEPLVPKGKEVTGPLVPEGKEATGPLVPEEKEVTGPLVPEEKEVTGPLVPEEKEVTRPLVAGPSLRACLLSPLFVLEVFWVSVLQLRYSFFLTSFNPWLTATFTSEQEVSELTNTLQYCMMAGLPISLTAGAVFDLFKHIFAKEAVKERRLVYPCVVLLAMTSGLAVLLSLSAAVPTSHLSVSMACALATGLRSFLYSVDSNVIILLFPSRYFTVLFSVCDFVGGAVSILQYAFVLWFQSSGFTLVNSMMLALPLLTFVHPGVQLYRTGIRSTAKESGTLNFLHLEHHNLCTDNEDNDDGDMDTTHVDDDRSDRRFTASLMSSASENV